jgi:hypothetical protein
MGELQLFDIIGLKTEYNLDIFVETGTGDGYSFKHLLDVTKDNKFSSYFSIEIFKLFYDKCVSAFSIYKDFNIHLINDTSVNGLTKILNQIPSDKNVLFWLDAHFPEADFGGPKSYGSVSDKKLRIPLEEELKLIKDIRPNNKDFLIIDDLRIYEDGNYEDGNWPDRHLYGGDGIQFIYDLFDKTHNISKLMNHQGYILLIPK